MVMEINIDEEKILERRGNNIIVNFVCENTNLVISCFWNIKKFILSLKFINIMSKQSCRWQKFNGFILDFSITGHKINSLYRATITNARVENSEVKQSKNFLGY